ncbi:MAG TPA: tRNA (adenosine(37)-N6)-threonylcarbamoyltransferase complex transferase subunit TsaD [Candidatus Paceibacterota bacterium]|nr:tRNA (adenosine(37)-N6)-threonylcarbamoyltransferase complex transferase subunit TsaD [Candidatus Paceibacterota bacterium]
MTTTGGIRVLGIETSCDETAASLISVDGATRRVTILGNAVHSQIDMHAPHGGVFPMLAKREHQANLVPVLEKVFAEASIKGEALGGAVLAKKKVLFDEIFAREPELRARFEEAIPALPRPDADFIAVTYGPGLEPALWVGVAFARALAAAWDVPLVPCNHMEGHIVAGLIKPDLTAPGVYDGAGASFPALSLLISGGHTQIVLAEKVGSYKVVGETRDDAIGECFDKVARMLGLQYPGGPKVSKLAAEARAKGLQSPEPLPRPMIDSKDLDFSFSGLKTAVLYLLKKLESEKRPLVDDIRAGICREAEDAVTEVVVAKMRAAIERFAVQSIVVGGGVIANSHIRAALEALAAECSIGIFLPQTDHATDNGFMIALAGYFNRAKAQSAEAPLRAVGNLPIGPRA